MATKGLQIEQDGLQKQDDQQEQCRDGHEEAEGMDFLEGPAECAAPLGGVRGGENTRRQFSEMHLRQRHLQ